MQHPHNDRLFCFDLVVDNLNLLMDNFLNNLNVSLYFRLLSFEAQPLNENFNLDDLAKSSAVQLGKSCLFQQDHESLIENLLHSHLILFLCQSENPRNLLASAKIPLIAAGNFLKRKSSIDNDNDNVQFAAAEVIKLINETSGDILAEIRIAYRIWLIHGKLTTFLKQHQDTDLQIANTAAVQGLFHELDKKLENHETQTDENIQQNGHHNNEPEHHRTERRSSNAQQHDALVHSKQRDSQVHSQQHDDHVHSPQNDDQIHSQQNDTHVLHSRHLGGQEESIHIDAQTFKNNDDQVHDSSSPEIQPQRHSLLDHEHLTVQQSGKDLNSSDIDQLSHFLGMFKNLDPHLHNFPLLQAISLELDRINKLKYEPKKKIISLANFERSAAEERRLKRHELCKSAYTNGQKFDSIKSFNLFSKIYSAQVPGYGVTKSYLQKVFYHPLYYPQQYEYSTPHTTKNVPTKLNTRQKLVSHRDVQVSDLDFEPKFKDASMMTNDVEHTVKPNDMQIMVEPTVRPQLKSSITQTENDFMFDRRTSNRNIEMDKSVNNWLQNSSKLYSKRRKSVRRKSSTKKPANQQFVRKSASPEKSRKSPSSNSYSSDFSSEKESGRGDIAASPLTESVKTEIREEPKSNLDSSEEVETKISRHKSKSVASSTSNSLIQTLTSMRLSLKQMAEQKGSESSTANTVKTLKTSNIGKSDRSSGTISEVESSSGRTSKRSESTIPEGIQRLAEKNLLAKMSVIQPTLPQKDPVSETRSASPVSLYLEKLSREQSLKQKNFMKRRSTVRTESVSSYMPTDLDNSS